MYVRSSLDLIPTNISAFMIILPDRVISLQLDNAITEQSVNQLLNVINEFTTSYQEKKCPDLYEIFKIKLKSLLLDLSVYDVQEFIIYCKCHRKLIVNTAF